MGSLKDEVREVAQIWTQDYNHYRPHDALGGQSPVMWKSGQQATSKANAFPDHFPTFANNNSETINKISTEITTFEVY